MKFRVRIAILLVWIGSLIIFTTFFFDPIDDHGITPSWGEQIKEMLPNWIFIGWSIFAWYIICFYDDSKKVEETPDPDVMLDRFIQEKEKTGELKVTQVPLKGPNYEIYNKRKQ